MHAWRTTIALLGLAIAVALATPAAADQEYHTERLDLEPVAGAPLRSGFVLNVHAEGPRVYALERYVLNGALPHTTYQVVLLVYPNDPACAGAANEIPTAQLTTNAAGNAEGRSRFVPADVPPLAQLGAAWQVRLAGVPAYATACTAITLD